MRESSKSILNKRRLQAGADVRMNLTGWLILAAFLCVCISLVRFATSSWRETSLLLGALVVLGWVACMGSSRKLGKLATARTGESICQFSRSFDRRRFDTVLIRAVYETIREQVCHPQLPLRADDRLIGELDLDDDDLEEIIMEASRLAGRSLEGTGRNPLHGRILTVRDVVEFLHHQPPEVAS